MGMETDHTTVVGDTVAIHGELEAAGEVDPRWVLRSVAVREQELHQVGTFLKDTHFVDAFRPTTYFPYICT